MTSNMTVEDFVATCSAARAYARIVREEACRLGALSGADEGRALADRIEASVARLVALQQKGEIL